MVSMCQQSVSICVNEVSRLTVEVLADEWISFPTQQQDINRIKARFMEKAHFPGVIGAVDCTHVAILAPNVEEHNYVNRKGFHSKNVQIICDYDLKILNINARFAGATHDAYIWRTSIIQEELERRYTHGERNSWRVGDSGYPQRPWLMTPLNNFAPGTPEYNYTRRQCSARNCIERCNGVLKARFRCILGERKLHYCPETVSQIIVACAILHNICVEGGLPFNIEFPQPDPDNENVLQGIIVDANEGVRVRQNLITRYFT